MDQREVDGRYNRGEHGPASRPAIRDKYILFIPYRAGDERAGARDTRSNAASDEESFEGRIAFA